MRTESLNHFADDVDTIYGKSYNAAVSTSDVDYWLTHQRTTAESTLGCTAYLEYAR